MSKGFNEINDLTRLIGAPSRYELESAMKKNLKDLRFINRLLKRLEAMDLNEETKDYLDRNKKVLRSNLKMANKSVNDLNTPKYNYSSSYSSNYSPSYDDDDGCMGYIIFWGLLGLIGVISSSC